MTVSNPEKNEAPSVNNNSNEKNNINKVTSKNEMEIDNQMSEEDRQLSDTLNMLIERLEESNSQLHHPALEALRSQIRSSAVSLTSVPKALKFLRKLYSRLVNIYDTCLSNEEDKQFLADIISVVAMTQPREESSTGTSAVSHDTLKYRIKGQHKDIGDWGHEYVRHLAMELIEAYPEAKENNDLTNISQYEVLIRQVSEFFLDHNSEPDACDLLMECGKLEMLLDLLFPNGIIQSQRDNQRVCLYLLSCVPYEADLDDKAVLETAFNIYLMAKDYPHAIVVAIRLVSVERIEQVWNECSEKLMRRQLAFILARQHLYPKNLNFGDDGAILSDIFNNLRLTDHYRTMAKELEIMEPKSPEDIYKSHLQDALRVTAVPSPRSNLAAALVSAFVNAGFGSDALLTSPEVVADESKSWIYKTKDHGLISTVASLGLLNLWNADTGLAALDKHLSSENPHIKAGAVLGVGLVHVGTSNEADPALALLREHLEEASAAVEVTPTTTATSEETGKKKGIVGGVDGKKLTKISALMGLALAYSGSGREDVSETIMPFISDDDVVIAAMAALSLGHVNVGTCDGQVASAILQTMMERDHSQLDKPIARFFALSLALVYLGKTETEAEVILETLQAIDHSISKDASTLVKICSYTGSGNVLKIQELLHLCCETPKAQKETEANNDSIDEDDSSTNSQAALAVIGISLICMMEDIGKEMSHRLFTHLMHFGSPDTRKAVPLALGLLYTSHPSPQVMDILSKYSHDHDKAVAVNSIFAMGLISAGTNNAKMAQMLRQLAAYYQRDVDCLYLVRLAQGLCHTGKGTISLSPINSHRFLLTPSAIAGLLTVAVALTDSQHLLIENYSFLIYFLTLSMYPRFATTLDAETLESVPVSMRVGQAVDVVGQAGKPKTITGFQTHTAPVLLAHQERAEFTSEEYTSLTPILENFILVKKNPNWTDDSSK